MRKLWSIVRGARGGTSTAAAVHLAVAMPADDAVFLEHGTGLGVADAGLRVGRKGAVVVGNHQGVGAEG
ncbi:hypothetical protein, partial [Aquabacterium sp.]|uniref:hypothetical protein n=1 Tax=Aquabacterium sp. TaxID=1872578 RepID=UPI0027B8E3E6